MVVVSGGWMKNVAAYPTPNVEADIVDTNDKEDMAAKAIFICRPNSHPFQERTILLDQPIKIGRSVARAKPAIYNAIFDCKVLSRHHALLWYENGKFYLQDTKSSNGTFVNNNRLSADSHELCSGDIVQFGVDVVENNRKVTHGCIIATLKLYLPDSTEAKASPSITEGDRHGVVPLDDLYALNQIIQEANQREQCLESKLTALQHVVEETKKSAEESWQAYVGEERLLSRLSALEMQLQQASKNWSEDRIKEEVAKLREINEQYQEAAKAALEKVHEEKLEAVSLAMEQERGRISAEQDALLAKEQLALAQLELQEIAQKLTEMHLKLEETKSQHEQYVQELEIKLDAEEIKTLKLEEKVSDMQLTMQVITKQQPEYLPFLKSKEDNLLAENEGIISQLKKSIMNATEQNHISFTVGPVEEETNESETKVDESEVVSKEEDELSNNENTQKIDTKTVTFKLPEDENDEDPLESQTDTFIEEEKETNNTETTPEKDEFDSRTLKYQFQSVQNELKRKIESLETMANCNKNRIAELERDLCDEKELNSARAVENDNLHHELTQARQQLKEHCNENTQLKDKVTLLTSELEESKRTVAVAEHETKEPNISTKSVVTFDQLVNLEEELVMLKERFAMNAEDKMKLQKELVKMTDQYNSMCNDVHNKHFFYIAPLVLMVLYLLVSAMIS